MKLTTLLFLASLIQVWATAYSQAIKFSFSVEDKQIVDVLKEIEESSNFRFFFIREQVDVEQHVTVKAQNATVEQIFDELFEGQGISYQVMENNLILISSDKNIFEIESVSSQQESVTGTVINENEQPLPGVSVVIKGTTLGTITNGDGIYSLSNVPSDATLVFSFIGMKTQEIPVGNQTSINVIMELDAIGIDEVVAVGYGVQKKVNLTGSVSSIGSKQLERRPIVSTSATLQGLAPGVTITTQSGSPGGDGGQIHIRGINSFG